MAVLGDAQLAVTTFFASSHPNDKCGANGLPLTPNSIKILGRCQCLLDIEHPRLCKYINVIRGKHERLVVVSEFYNENLTQKLGSLLFDSESAILQLAYEILVGLSYLNSRGIVHRNLTSDNVLFDKAGAVKLSKYGMYHMTDSGADLDFPIGLPRYLSPEVLCSSPTHNDDTTDGPVPPPLGPKADVWSVGILLLEVLLGHELWSDLSIPNIVENVLNLVLSLEHPVDVFTQQLGLRLHGYTEHFLDLLRKCLTVSPTLRPSPCALLNHTAFKEQRLNEIPYKNGYRLFSTALRCKDLELPVYDDEGKVTDDNMDHLGQRSMEEFYYLWGLAGGDLEATLRKADLVKAKPPITLVANFVCSEGEMFGQKRDGCTLLDNTQVVLSQEQLRHRLRDIDEAAYYLLLEDEATLSVGLPSSPSSVDLTDTANLPIVIREKDVEYQFHRIILYERLLKGYPYKKAHIWKEARVDIPPLYRAHAWAAVLEVEGDIEGRYEEIDKETPTATDRQIEVDIPRCHQYHELLSSPHAHMKLKRILKAWVVSHPEYVYWQGLDSLCAPFLALNFNNEALAYACLAAFIPKYLHKFFLRDNSPVIQEYLAVFSHLIVFHDPELGNHLDGIGFIPDLYAIPWFLTMYAHVFPLRKIFHLWDTLLLGNSSFPLCIGVAILEQLRDRLLSYGFNECILLFSDMPEIDIENVVRESIKIFCSTPKSATYRQHGRPPVKVKSHDPDTRQTRSHSYYSRDYNEQTLTELSMKTLTLDELKSDKCPRISAEDLIELTELSGPAYPRSPTKRYESSKPCLLIIDVRSPDEFKRGIIPHSINIPFHTAFSPEGELVPCQSVHTLNSHRALVKVIVGSRSRNASNFANELVRLQYTKVCILHKGIDVLRATGLLTIPPVEI